MRTVLCSVIGLFVVMLLAGGSASTQSGGVTYEPVTEQMLLDPPPGDWPMWRRTYNHWGYSPLDQINTSNVGSLRLAWAWTMDDGRQGFGLGELVVGRHRTDQLREIMHTLSGGGILTSGSSLRGLTRGKIQIERLDAALAGLAERVRVDREK